MQKNMIEMKEGSYTLMSVALDLHGSYLKLSPHNALIFDVPGLRIS